MFKIDKSSIAIEGNKLIIEVPDAAALAPLLNAGKVPLSSLSPGDTFPIGDETFIVLEQTENGTRVISEGFPYSDEEFGDCSDWKASPIRDKLNGEYLQKLTAIVGIGNVIPMERDLTSLDGLDDYGTCKDSVSLLTAAEYAKYHKVLGLNSNYDNWWWTITPASAPSNNATRSVCSVCFDGTLSWDLCNLSGNVRPFLTLESSILVQNEEPLLTMDSVCLLTAAEYEKYHKASGLKPLLTKDELRFALRQGFTLENLFNFRDGQECEMFKTAEFIPGDKIIYIPDLFLNEIDKNRSYANDDIEEIDDVLCHCYTGDNFIALCKERFGNVRAGQKAVELFEYVDWQHPDTVLECGELDD